MVSFTRPACSRSLSPLFCPSWSVPAAGVKDKSFVDSDDAKEKRRACEVPAGLRQADQGQGRRLGLFPERLAEEVQDGHGEGVRPERPRPRVARRRRDGRDYMEQWLDKQGFKVVKVGRRHRRRGQRLQRVGAARRRAVLGRLDGEPGRRRRGPREGLEGQRRRRRSATSRRDPRSGMRSRTPWRTWPSRCQRRKVRPTPAVSSSTICTTEHARSGPEYPGPAFCSLLARGTFLRPVRPAIARARRRPPVRVPERGATAIPEPSPRSSLPEAGFTELFGIADENLRAIEDAFGVKPGGPRQRDLRGRAGRSRGRRPAPPGRASRSFWPSAIRCAGSDVDDGDPGPPGGPDASLVEFFLESPFGPTLKSVVTARNIKQRRLRPDDRPARPRFRRSGRPGRERPTSRWPWPRPPCSRRR